MSLPTYEDTVRGPNVFTFMALYLDRVSLLDASLACKDWYQAFGPHLWSDPIELIAETRTPFGKTHILFTDTR
jgi:hypothetical protein